MALSLFRPSDRLLRFHAGQARLLHYCAFALLLAVGFAALAQPPQRRDAWGLLAGLVLLADIGYAAVGVQGAVRGRFTRLQPLFAGLSRLHNVGRRVRAPDSVTPTGSSRHSPPR